MRSPWWFCFGWSARSLLCVADTLSHAATKAVPARYKSRANVALNPICERHDRALFADLRSKGAPV